VLSDLRARHLRAKMEMEFRYGGTMSVNKPIPPRTHSSLPYVLNRLIQLRDEIREILMNQDDPKRLAILETYVFVNSAVEAMCANRAEGNHSQGKSAATCALNLPPF
jgi:hypothetical protein